MESEKRPSDIDHDSVMAAFEFYMQVAYPEGSGNAKGAFYDDDMRNAFEAGYTARAHER